MAITWGKLSDQLIAQAKEKNVPIIGQFELTPRCNLHCKMCYICTPANDEISMIRERTAAEWIQLAKDARDEGLLYLLLTGGEVFIREDFREIYEAISTMGFCIEIYTNGTMITPEIAKWLGRIPPSKIGVTIYGAAPETYERVCGDAGGFESAVRGIDLLLEQGITVDMKTTVVRGNTKDFDKLTAFAERRRIEFGVVNYITPRREGLYTDPVSERLSPLEMAEYECHVERYFEMKASKLLGKSEFEKCSIDKENRINLINNNENSPFYCAAGKCAFWVNWDGRMTPCGMIDKLVSFPFENGFSAAWKEIQNLCATVNVCEACSRCDIKDYCLACPASLECETGVFDKPAPYLCERAKQKVILEKDNKRAISI